MIWFTSDTHFNHANIIKYCNRPFSSIQEMNETIINNWNSVVTKDDTVYHLGDFAFGKVNEFANKLNGKIVLIKGNHDTIPHNHMFAEVCDTKIVTIDNQMIFMSHFAHRVWPRSHYNTWHLYGHCLDLCTEVLTFNGWKTRDRLLYSDLIVTLNTTTSQLEYNAINEIVDTIFDGDVYSIRSRGIDLRVTSNHVIVEKEKWKHGKHSYRKFFANSFANCTRRYLVKAGDIKNTGVDISDNHIRLMVQIAADGSLCNKDLVRIRVAKERKQERIRALLLSLCHPFKEHQQKDGSISFDFNVPTELLGYSLKPLDSVFMHVNTDQLQILLDEYSHTDGYTPFSEVIVIYTSKAIEADIIQAACVVNSYQCNIATRVGHGYSKQPSYELVITNGDVIRSVANTKKATSVEYVMSESFWCLCVANKTLMVRRNGKPVIVGNSHARIDSQGKSFDVGVDTNKYRLYSFEDIKSKMYDMPDNWDVGIKDGK